MQTRQTLEHVRAILAGGGSSVEDVLMFRVYLPHEVMLAEIDALAVTD